VGNHTELLTCLARARFLSKRACGSSEVRTDGSSCSEDIDIEATAAEYFAAEHCGVPFNATVSSRGDGGADFFLQLSVEVVHLGMVGDQPRRTGHLIVNPHEPQRWADIYLVVAGSIVEGFEILGWYPHQSLVEKPMLDFGYGDRYALHVDDLIKSDLRKLRR